MMFEEKFCARCVKSEDCEIWTAALCFSVDEPDYPKELVFDADGRPTCKGFADEHSERVAPRCDQTLDLFK
jgi:hypothetical protein